MEKTKVLYITQEITPYLPESDISLIGRFLPQGIQERGREIRTFMPRYGNINERRNQLHEVIRLSGMNLIIDDTDHPLIIKVASIQSARMQVYFIDNDDFFRRKHVMKDENGIYFPDNDDRTVFFTRGVIETVKKLRWEPDIVHCHGWITSILPLFLKRAYHEDPLFHNSNIIYSVYNDDFTNSFNKSFRNKLMIEGITEKDIDLLSTADYINLSKMAIQYSDGIIIGSEKINPKIEKFIKTLDKPVLPYQGSEEYIDSYSDFYDKIMENSLIEQLN